MTRLLLALVLVFLCMGALGTMEPPPVDAAPGQDVPAGCPGGPPGPAVPGTRCPDGSIAGQPPAGCPGGPPGPAYPGTVCPDGSIPVPAGAPTGCQFGPSGNPAPGTTCPDGTAPRDRQADRELRNIFGIEEGDQFPLTAYDIGCDEGAWNAFLRKMWCAAQAFPFSIGKWFIGIGIELLAWALEFRVAETLTPVAALLSRVYDTSLIGAINLEELAWTVALFAGGWNIMKARFAEGARDIFLTFLIAIFGGFVLSNPQGYLEGTIELAQNSSGAVLEAVDGALTDTPAQDASAVRDRLGGVLRRSFVGEPYDLINWGSSLTGECAAARDEILAGGPWGDDDRPREIMRARGCEAQAEYNADPTDERAAASLTVAVASVMVTVLMVMMALAVFVAQITLVALFSGASVVWVLALFPGNRSVLWWWISRLVWAVAVTFASMFLLSWAAITVTAVLDATTDLSIVQRCLIAIVIVGVAWKFRSSIDTAIDSTAKGLAQKMRRSAAPVSQTPTGAGFMVGGAPKLGALPYVVPPPNPPGVPGPLSVSPMQATGVLTAASAAGVAYGHRTQRLAMQSLAGGRAAVRGTQTLGGTVAGGATALMRAPTTARQAVTQRSMAVRSQLQRARAGARAARNPVAAARAARAARSSNADVTDWI
ncbi:MAG TPA: hypothetical protein VIL36_03145 [Acidimicrobiales bacterium]